MGKKEIFEHVQETVRKSKIALMNHDIESEQETINRVYEEIKPTASRATKSAQRVKVLSGDYFGGNLAFFLELLDQCGLEVVEKKSK